MQAPRREFIKGEPKSNFAAKDYNDLAEYIEGLANLTVAHPLYLKNGENGMSLRMDRKKGFWARVLGTANPYGFTQLFPENDRSLSDDANGYSSPTSPSAGEFMAYEVNGVEDLNGTVQWLIPGWSDDFRFQDVANGEGGGTVIDPPCLDGVTNPEATYTGHLTFSTTGAVPPFPTMDVTFFPHHVVVSGVTSYRWDTGFIKYPPGSEGLDFYGDFAYFLMGVGCNDPRPDAGLYFCDGPPEAPEPCSLQNTDAGTPFIDPVDGPVVIYTATAFVLSGFQGNN